MNIIIEGPDGAGKSTLAEHLAKILGMSVVHFEYPGADVNQFEWFKGFLEKTDNKIIDRCWYSDMVYGPIFRGHARVTLDEMWELERRATDTILIYCTGEVPLMYEAARDRGEDFVETYTQYKQIAEAYDEIMVMIQHYIPVHIREATWLS